MMKIITLFFLVLCFVQHSFSYMVDNVVEVVGTVVEVKSNMIQLKTSNVILDIPTKFVSSEKYKKGEEAKIKMKKTELEEIYKKRHLSNN